MMNRGRMEAEIAAHVRPERRASIPIYETSLGAAFCGVSFKILRSKPFEAFTSKVQLAFTSPPFPLNTKKSYGNLRAGPESC